MSEKNKKTRKAAYVWDEIRGLYILSKKRKAPFILRLILIAIVVALIIRNIFNQNFESMFVCISALILFMMPPFLDKNFGISLPTTLEIIVLLFIFASEILGEMGNAYALPFWDVMLHATNGFGFAAIGFALLDIINRNRAFKFKLPPIFLAIVAFCFSTTVGVLWEFFEFASDNVIGTDMQKDTWVTSIDSYELYGIKSNINGVDEIEKTVIVLKDGTEVIINGDKQIGYLDIGLVDTMKDLAVDCIGALVFSIIGYFYIKERNLKFAEHFIPVIKTKEEMKQMLDELGGGNMIYGRELLVRDGSETAKEENSSDGLEKEPVAEKNDDGNEVGITADLKDSDIEADEEEI